MSAQARAVFSFARSCETRRVQGRRWPAPRIACDARSQVRGASARQVGSARARGEMREGPAFAGGGSGGSRCSAWGPCIRHVAPGAVMVPGVSLFGTDAASSASSRTRAKHATRTDRAPALRSTPTQASVVAPLVTTSSTSRMSLPSINALRRGSTAIAPLSVRRRIARPSPPRLGVRLRRARPSTTSCPWPSRSSSRPSSAAWL